MELRSTNQQRAVETIMVGVIALMSAALLPSLLLQYFYDINTLTAEPTALKMVPMISYVISALYFLFAATGNVMREKQIGLLKQELRGLTQPMSSGETTLSDTELTELEAMVDSVLEAAPKKKSTSKRKVSRKAK